MKRVIFLVTLLSAAALFCGCSSEEGTVNSNPVEPAGPEDSIYGSVSGYCVDSGGNKENFITCYVHVCPTGEESFAFYPGFSDTDPMMGVGFFECDRVPYVVPPLDGTYLYVIGYDHGDLWGVSDPFAWTDPMVTGVIVNEQ